MGQKFVVMFFWGILSEKKKCKIATNKMLNRKFPDVHVLNHLRDAPFLFHDLWGMVYLKAPFRALIFGVGVSCLLCVLSHGRMKNTCPPWDPTGELQ